MKEKEPRKKPANWATVNSTYVSQHHDTRNNDEADRLIAERNGNPPPPIDDVPKHLEDVPSLIERLKRNRALDEQVSSNQKISTLTEKSRLMKKFGFDEDADTD